MRSRLPQNDRIDRARRPQILLLGDSLVFGGTEGQFVEVAHGLSRSGWGVHMGCVRAEGPHLARLEAAGLHPLNCGLRSLRSLHFALTVARLAGILRGRGIRLVHSFGLYSNIVGVLAARLAQVPVVASQRDLGNLSPPLQRRVLRVALRLAGHVMVNSEAVAERLRASGTVAAQRIVLIPNGVDSTRFAPAPDSRAVGSFHVTVGTLAVLRPEKALSDLVRAASMVRERYAETRFVIWGDGPCRPELERLVQDLGLEDAVEFRRATTQPETALRHLDIFVLPSTSEACSNAILEAMATGVPVVATRVGGIPALVEDGRTGLLVPPSDHRSLARAILQLIENPVLATRFAAEARERVQNEFSLDRMLARIEALYDAALTQSRDRSSDRLIARCLDFLPMTRR